MLAISLAITSAVLTLWHALSSIPNPPSGQMLLHDTASDAALLVDDDGCFLSDHA